MSDQTSDGAEAGDVYQLFGKGTAAGRAIFNLYNKKVAVPVPKPKQKTAEQIQQDKLRDKPKPKPKPEIEYPTFTKPATPVFVEPMKRKPLTAILAETNDYQPEPARPLPSKFKVGEKEKKVFQDKLENHGKPVTKPASRGGVSRPPPPPKSAKEELYDMLVQEIDERQRFLDEMDELGQRKQYEAQIMFEIKQRMEELRKLELRDV